MATETYQVKVVDVHDKELTLEMQIIGADEYYFYGKKNFVLQVLWDSAQQNADTEIIGKISMDQILDPAWVLENAEKLIKSVKVLETKNYPDESQIGQMNRAAFDAFRKEHGIPTAQYKIVIEDGQLISHLKPGATWKSAAYDLED